MKVIVGKAYGCVSVWAYNRKNIFDIVDTHKTELELVKECDLKFYEQWCEHLLDHSATSGWLCTINGLIDHSDYDAYEIVEVTE